MAVQWIANKFVITLVSAGTDIEKTGVLTRIDCMAEVTPSATGGSLPAKNLMESKACTGQRTSDQHAAMPLEYAHLPTLLGKAY